MAANLTDHVWTMEDVLRYRVLPTQGAPPPRQMDDVGRGRATRCRHVKTPPTEVAA